MQINIKHETLLFVLGKLFGCGVQNFSNLSKVDFIKDYYLYYRSWNEVYDYIRSDDCEIP